VSSPLIHSDRILGLKADLSDQKNLRETMDGLLSKAKEELAELTLCYAEKEKEFADHQLTIQQLQEENQKLSDELTALTNHKLELETRSISRQDYDELEGKLQTLSGFTDFMLMVLDLCLSLSLSLSLSVSLSLSLPLSLSASLPLCLSPSLSTGEKNHYQQMTQSLGKELKRVMRSSQQEVTALTNDLSSQKEMYEVRIVFVFLAPLSLTHSRPQRLMAQFNELKAAMEEETRKKQEEELQKSKGFFSRKKKETTDASPAAASAATSSALTK
jgi:hypothetical protein